MKKTYFIVFGIIVVAIVIALLVIVLAPQNRTSPTTATQTLGESLYEEVSKNPVQNMPNTNPLSSDRLNPFETSYKNPFE